MTVDCGTTSPHPPHTSHDPGWGLTACPGIPATNGPTEPTPVDGGCPVVSAPQLGQDRRDCVRPSGHNGPHRASSGHVWDPHDGDLDALRRTDPHATVPPWQPYEHYEPTTDTGRHTARCGIITAPVLGQRPYWCTLAPRHDGQHQDTETGYAWDDDGTYGAELISNGLNPDQEIRHRALRAAASLFLTEAALAAGPGVRRLARTVLVVADEFEPYIRDGSTATLEADLRADPEDLALLAAVDAFEDRAGEAG